MLWNHKHKSGLLVQSAFAISYAPIVSHALQGLVRQAAQRAVDGEIHGEDTG